MNFSALITRKPRNNDPDIKDWIFNHNKQLLDTAVKNCC